MDGGKRGETSLVQVGEAVKILYVGWGLAKASGVTTFVARTAEELRRLGHSVDVVDTLKQPDVVLLDGYDLVHLHCLWQLHKYAVAARKAKVPIVWSTHGMTAPWAMRHKWLKKKIAWWMFQRRDLKSAAAVHCTTEQETKWNEALGFRTCFVVPLGTEELFNHVEQVEHAEKRLLFVGRVHPVKGLANLIRAWHILHESTCSTWLNWKLRIVGPDEANHLSCLKSEVRSLGLEDSVEFAGPKFGEELSREYENCDCLVLPSFTENFGATVVDAMAHGKPVITSTFTPWHEVKERGCGWWVSNEPKHLAEAITDMISVGDDARMGMGARGFAFVKEKYSWPAVAAQMERVYNESAAHRA